MKRRFNTQLKEAISCSAEEAWRFLDAAITPAHLLLGIIRQADNAALTILTKGFGVSPADLKTSIEAALVHVPSTRRRGLTAVKQLPLDRDAERIIRGGVQEAERLKTPKPVRNTSCSRCWIHQPAPASPPCYPAMG
jgi:ATP-dependent Clp protease ATP-binding subunit ClpA